MEDKLERVTHLRNNEYYDMQDVLDNLYKLSEENFVFKDLISLILKPNNLRLAYRNIKTNKGSKTNGLSGKNIKHIAKMSLEYYLIIITMKILCYKPQIIKRVGIPKSNGKIRYLGIKEPIEKIIEQAIYQILEPIVMAKFHKNSNGFIKGKSCSSALAQMNDYILREKLYYVVDIDIKGFFDNVNHGKLLKQLWTLKIRDKNLLCIISKMLKAEVYKVGIPEKGTPQGGILSPLLANVVLNELDWWLEGKKAKGIRFVRYADDFKILCPTFSTAGKMLEKTTKWLDNRLKLEVSEEKTKIVNLKKNYSEFLGFKIKVKNKNGKVKIVSHMSDKAIKSTKRKCKQQLKIIKKVGIKQQEKEIDYYNSIIMGKHNYYESASMIAKDMSKIDFIISQNIYRYFKNILKYDNKTNNDCFIIRKYGNGKKLPYIRGKPIIPIGRIEYSQPKYKGENINYFNEHSRNTFHKKLNLDNSFIINDILDNPYLKQSVEFNDNVISKFCGQYGKYAITGQIILNMKNCVAISKNKFTKHDNYNNIILVESKVANIIEKVVGDDMLENYWIKREFSPEQLKQINAIRKRNKMLVIQFN